MKNHRNYIWTKKKIKILSNQELNNKKLNVCGRNSKYGRKRPLCEQGFRHRIIREKVKLEKKNC